jgi:hypothetical protein
MHCVSLVSCMLAEVDIHRDCTAVSSCLLLTQAHCGITQARKCWRILIHLMFACFQHPCQMGTLLCHLTLRLPC